MLVGSSRSMQVVREHLARLAPFPWSVRIEGPTGTGKNLAARLLHDLSPRSSGPFVACPINTFVDTLAVAELTGYVRGAFTDAQDRMGLFEQAHHGTLFLDELATASPNVQNALLHLIESGEVLRIGERRPRRVDVRLVFATNADLPAASAAGQFRDDLLFRLGALTVRMPRLAEHPEDIPELAAHILMKKCREAQVQARVLERREVAALTAYQWPGNVRELEKALEHFVVFEALPALLNAASPKADWRPDLVEVLARHEGNKAAAARELGISRKTLHDELRRRRGGDRGRAIA